MARTPSEWSVVFGHENWHPAAIVSAHALANAACAEPACSMANYWRVFECWQVDAREGVPVALEILPDGSTRLFTASGNSMRNPPAGSFKLLNPQSLASRKAAAPIKPAAAQTFDLSALPLFGDQAKQTDLLDLLKG